MFPLSTVLFPHAALPLHVFEPRYRRLTADCLAGDRQFGIVLIERGSEVGGGDVRSSLGTRARIEVASPLGDGRWALLVRGVDRIGIRQWLPDDPYPTALVDDRPSAAADGDAEALTGEAEWAVRRARGLLSELGRAPALPADAQLGDDPDERVWRLCAEAPLGPADAHRLLGVDDPAERLRTLIGLVGELAEDLAQMLQTGG